MQAVSKTVRFPQVCFTENQKFKQWYPVSNTFRGKTTTVRPRFNAGFGALQNTRVNRCRAKLGRQTSLLFNSPFS